MENANKKMSKELTDKVIQLVESAKNSGKVRRGTNEATKSIERGEAQLVVIAGDVEPAEVVMHLPGLCNEKKIPCVYIPSKAELGRASGIDVPTAAVALADIGDAKGQLKDVLKLLENKVE